ncbi:MAG: hypothetical protein ACRC8S_13490 [Fimbriiglobus sp.]
MSNPPTPPKLRARVVAPAFFVGGLASRFVLDQTFGDPSLRSMYSMSIQTLAYGGGLLVLGIWWLRSADVSLRSLWTCLGWHVLAVLSIAAILSSSYK